MPLCGVPITHNTHMRSAAAEFQHELQDRLETVEEELKNNRGTVKEKGEGTMSTKKPGKANEREKGKGRNQGRKCHALRVGKDTPAPTVTAGHRGENYPKAKCFPGHLQQSSTAEHKACECPTAHFCTELTLEERHSTWKRRILVLRSLRLRPKDRKTHRTTMPYVREVITHTKVESVH